MKLLKQSLYLLMLLFFVACGGSEDAKDEEPASEFEALENEIFKVVNEYRVSLGKPEVVQRDIITKHCRDHSIYMAKTGDLGHHNFSEVRIPGISEVITDALFMSENSAQLWEGDDAKTAFQVWFDSPNHKKNMEGNWDYSGVGVAVSEDGKMYATQIFVKVQ